MDKVLVIIPDNNKGKNIAKGYISAFKDLNYFVIEKKIYDLSLDEVNLIKPDIIFCFWSEMINNEELLDFFKLYDGSAEIISCAELSDDIPSFIKKKSHCFTPDIKDKKHKLILGINAKDYKEKFKGFKYSITFAGNPASDERERLLSKIIKNFGPINIFCRSFDFYKCLDEMASKKLLDDYHLELYKASYQGYVENPKELAKIFSSSKVNIDMKNPNNKDLNYRFLEILASGGFLLSPKNDVTSLYFEDGKEFDSYVNDVDLIDKIDFYLKNVNIAQLISSKGRKNVVSNHSFYDRLKSMLKVIYGKDFSSRR